MTTKYSKVLFTISMIGLTSITFAGNVIGDVPSSSAEQRTIQWESTLYTWACDISQELAFYEGSPVYLRVGQPRGQVSYVFDKTQTYVRAYNQALFAGELKFPYVSNFVPSSTIDPTDGDILTVDATGSTFTKLPTIVRNKIAGQFVTFNNERSIIQSANGSTLNYYYVKANDLSLHNWTLKVTINPNITKKISCTNYYIARCGDGVIDKETWTTNGNWGLSPQWWGFLPWHPISIKPNEACDDGEQNGQAGKCKTDCTGIWSGTETGNLIVTKTLTAEQNYAEGDSLQFRISFSNPSTQTIQNIAIEDFLPSGLEYISSEINWATAPVYFATGMVSGTTRIAYTGFSLAAGQNGYILINAKLVSCNATLNNVLWTAVSNGQNLGWNTNKLVVCSGGTPVSITKTANKTSVQWGDLVQYTIVVKNNTPNAISSVFIQDIWPGNGCLFMTGSYTPSSLLLISSPWSSTTQWWLPSLGANETISLTFYGQASTSPSCVWAQTNVGQVIYNGNQSIPSSATVTITPAIEGMSITKEIIDYNDAPGERVTYRITYRNNSDVPINGFVVTDIWPSSLKFIRSTRTPTTTNPYTWVFSTILQPREEWSIEVVWEILNNIQ